MATFLISLCGIVIVEKLDEIIVTDESVVVLMAPSTGDGQEQLIETVCGRLVVCPLVTESARIKIMQAKRFLKFIAKGLELVSCGQIYKSTPILIYHF